MFWADKIAKSLKGKQHIDDMKTPSGRIHVGALRGVIIHDLIFRALCELDIKAEYTYVINDYDPFDSLPVYLPKKYVEYLGWPLFKIPSPKKGFRSLAEFYALEFMGVFNKLGARPKIIWSSDLYQSGKMDKLIRIALDNAEKIQDIYQQVSGSKKREISWLPFQPICQKCGKLGTTKAYKWDGENVYYRCEPKMVSWAVGCDYEGKISPFGGSGKLPWKVDWPAHWKVLGVTFEGAGKDHFSKGGSWDIAAALCEKVFNYPRPQGIGYEFFLVKGAKMSSSQGIGASAYEMAEILPAEILRFLMVRTNYNQTIDFSPDTDIIPKLFDEYDRCAKEYLEKGKNSPLGRIFELSQINSQKIEPPVKLRFRQLAQLIQMPNMVDEINSDPVLKRRAGFAKIWLEKFASEEEKFTIQENLPKEVKKLTDKQRQLLNKIIMEMDKKWEPEKFQNEIYKWGKSLGLTSTQTFQAIYLPLLGKDHGPRAAWLILSLPSEFIKKRFTQASTLVL